MDFANFAKLPKKAKLVEKFELPDKRRFKPMKTRKKRFLPHSQPPFTN